LTHFKHDVTPFFQTAPAPNPKGLVLPLPIHPYCTRLRGRTYIFPFGRFHPTTFVPVVCGDCFLPSKIWGCNPSHGAWDPSFSGPFDVLSGAAPNIWIQARFELFLPWGPNLTYVGLTSLFFGLPSLFQALNTAAPAHVLLLNFLEGTFDQT